MKYCILILLFVSTQILFAQTDNKEYNQKEEIWLGYFNQTRVSKRFGLWTDVHLRSTDDFVGKLSQGIIRIAPSYYISDQVRVMAGYAFVNHFPTQGHKNISQPEHRPWQQLWWQQNYNGFRTLQWIRFEQRFRNKILNDNTLADGYDFNFRIRYNLMLLVPLNNKKIEKGTLFLATSDELFINFGKKITFNYFDQNRAFLGLGYQFGKHINAQLGYMNIFQQRSSGNKYDLTHAIRLFVFHTFDFRKLE